MGFTMLQQACRTARLTAIIHNNQNDNQHPLQALMQDLTGTWLKESKKPRSKRLKEFKFASHYNSLVQYLQQSTGQPWCSYEGFAHPPNSLIVPYYAEHHKHLEFEGKRFSCQSSLVGNGSIQYYTANRQVTGRIDAIWKLDLHNNGELQTFLWIERHSPLHQHEVMRTPYAYRHALPLHCTVVSLEHSEIYDIIQPQHIITHLTMRRRPKGTYGIGRDFLIVCWGLNRGKK
jgi:hypothetical protein